MQNSNARTIGQKEQRFNAIMNSRQELTASAVGTPVRCQISGNPKLGWYDSKMDTLKDIYSFNVYKSSVTNSAWFTEELTKAIALEAAGAVDAAEALFNELLNRSQLNLAIINRDGTKQQFASNQTVDVLIGAVVVQEKKDGVPTGATHIAHVAVSMSPVSAVILSKPRKWGAPIVSETVPSAAPAATETGASAASEVPSTPQTEASDLLGDDMPF